MNRKTGKWVAALGTALLVVGPAFAADNEPAKRPNQAQADKAALQAQPGDDQNLQRDDFVPRLERSGELIGMKVLNKENKDLGEIQDLVLDNDSDRIAYAVLSFGGALGLGEKYFAIPWSALQYNHLGKHFTLDLTKQQLQRAGGFDKDKWPEMGDPQWGKQIHQEYDRPYYRDQDQQRLDERRIRERDRELRDDADPARKGSRLPDPDLKDDAARRVAAERRAAAAERDVAEAQPEDRAQAADQKHFWMRRVSQLDGTTVQNRANENLGKIKEVVIDMYEGRPAYAIITDGGTLGIGETLSPVPWSALHMRPRQEVAVLDTDAATLKAVGFKEGKYPDFADQAYAQRLHDQFKQEPYWVVFGYVRADERANFDANTIKTIKGTVETVNQVERGSATVTVKTDDGRMVLVRLAPQRYLQEKGLNLQKGDKVTITGSEVMKGDQHQIIATQVKKGDQTIELRTREGQSNWREERQPGERPDAENVQPGERKPETPRN